MRTHDMLVARRCRELDSDASCRVRWRLSWLGAGFLPLLGIALRADSVALTRKWLGSVAQETVLAMLRGQLAHPFADRDIVRLTGCSRASAFRAFRELTTFGLVERIPGGYAFVPDAAQTLRLHMPRLRNSPVREALVETILA